VDQLFRYLNGHPLSMAYWFMEKKSLKGLVDHYVKSTAKFFDSPHGITFYRSLTAMFQSLEADPTRICQVETSVVDYRFVDEYGQILSPLFLDVFKLALIVHPPPKSIFEDASLLSSLGNAFEQGWVLERMWLQEQNLFFVSQACIALFPLYAKFDCLQPTARIMYQDVKDIVRNIPTSAKFILTCIPDVVIERDIDCIQIYGNGNELLLIGHQVSKQSAQEHKKSLRWSALVRTIRAEAFMKDKTLDCLLIFICKQSPKPVISEEKNVVEEFKDLGIMVADYGISGCVKPNAAKLFQFEPVTVVARQLTLIELKPKEKCGCLKTLCDSGHCACFKVDRYCDPDACGCTASSCKNREGPAVKKLCPPSTTS